MTAAPGATTPEEWWVQRHGALTVRALRRYADHLEHEATRTAFGSEDAYLAAIAGADRYRIIATELEGVLS